MKLNVIFIIAAIYGIVGGASSLLAPGAGAGDAVVNDSGFAFMSMRFLGVAYIGLGLIAWLMRNAEPSKARNSVTLGLAVFFALHALTSLYGQFTDTSVSTHWVMATVQALIAVGFFLAGRASMSGKSA